MYQKIDGSFSIGYRVELSIHILISSINGSLFSKSDWSIHQRSNISKKKRKYKNRCCEMMKIEASDICLNSAMMCWKNDEDDLLPDELANIEITPEFDCLISSIMNECKQEKEETFSIDEFLFDSSSSSHSNTSSQVSPCYSMPIDMEYPPLSFINPPESHYHVRYVSEITELPLNGSIVNTRMKNKKNLSGRYLKGLHGRYITIAFPEMLSDYSNLYIRVTRLTVPYQDISFIHPYPLYYSSKKAKYSPHVISQGSSIYFKITTDELRYCSKHFPNIILTRRKQCDLNKMLDLYPFDNNSDLSHSFHGRNAKEKIILYQLKQSQLDFRLTIQCEQTNQFIDTDIFCRSNALVEAEGIEWKQ